MVVATNKQLDRFFSLTARACLASSATTRRFKFTHRHPLEITGFRKKHDGSLIGDQINVFQTTGKIKNLGATRNGMAITQLPQLIFNDSEHPLPAAKDVLVVGDLGDQILMLKADFVRL